ncbi:unnamed protein product [Polarella glacialis]|uniref:N-acetyltransferase domain-containing protein n=2 Tax=Polarella glacialis TaxID=89957 RepID=A0A813D2E7_POLGL|nr:unnamed protein product [Polarella glacialis]
MEEGEVVGAPRTSKRLKRKRGESSEYVKVNHLLVTRAHRDEGLGVLLLTAVLHRVKCLDPDYAREIFLTVVQKNAQAVGLYQRLGLKVIGQNTTHLAKGKSDKSRPIVWYQMGLSNDRNGSHEEQRPRIAMLEDEDSDQEL